LSKKDGEVSGSANPPRELRVFRERLYAAFNRRADALFELTDAALTAGAVTDLEPAPPLYAPSVNAEDIEEIAKRL